MMSITRVSSASASHYYTRDDYYTRGDVGDASSWSGKGAERLGLVGSVEKESFQGVLDGKLPDGPDLNENGGDKRRAGFDATFSAPKSVSLLAEVAGDVRLTEAHNAATEAGLNYLQEHAAYARVTENGETRLQQTGNLVIAQFTHHTSRAGDPQLHSHSVILNVTQRSDGEWRALAGEKLFEAKMASGAVYRATLAHELQERGYEIHITHADGRFEIAEMSKEQLQHFSQRSQDIRAAMDQRGLTSAKEAERATLLTRGAKKDVNIDQLREEWRVRAREQGMNLNGIVRQAQERVALGIDRTNAPLHAKEAVEWAIAHTTERQTLVSTLDLDRYATEKATGKAGFADVRQAITEQEKNGRLIRVGDRYTTFHALTIEHETVEMMRTGQDAVRPFVDRKGAEHTTTNERLTQGQQAAATHILSTPDRFSGVQGFAGTGKTTMLREVQGVLSERGVEIRGLAVSASAARTLEQESGIPSQTVAQFLAQQSGSQALAKETGKERLYVLDESSMLGSKAVHRLMQTIEREGSRAVLVGDPAQLGSIEAGKPFAVLIESGMSTARMTEILRQKDLALKEVAQLAAAGRVTDTINRLEQFGRILAVADRTDRLNAVSQQYLSQDAASQEKTLVLTGSRADRTSLNEMIREGLKEQGILAGPEIRTDVLVQKDLTKAQLRDAVSYEAGDVVRFGKPYSGLGVEKGSYGIVDSANVEAGKVQIHMEGTGKTVKWQPERYTSVEVYRREERVLQNGDLVRWTRNDYAEDRRNGEIGRITINPSRGEVSVTDKNGKQTTLDAQNHKHWDHGYVSTVHAAQGLTADRTIFHADSQQLATNKEGWYVAVSRARHDLRVVTDDVASLRESVGESRAQESAIEAVGKDHPQMSNERATDRDLTGTGSGTTARQAELER
jgi:conjugative relaxase-like TrwC/TraI family protein